MSSKEAKYNFTLVLIAVLIAEGIFWILFFGGYILFTQTVEGFRFEHHRALWALGLLPLLAGAYLLLILWKNKALTRFGDSSLLSKLVPDLSSARSAVKFLFFRFGLAFLIIALANPQFGTKVKEGKTQGIDVMICLDLSKSMLAEDLSPNRLDRAKRAIEKLVNRLHGDRLGIVVFGGEAYVQLPITMDHGAAKLFLSNIDTDIIPVQGTAIGSSIDLALRSFDFKNGTQKSIIVISDGENHRDDPVAAADRAAEKDVIIHTIGMGSPDGAPVPIYKNNRQVGYKKDKQGKTIVSKLDEQTLMETASAGNGTYIRASNSRVGLGILMDELEKLQKTTYDTKVYTDFADRFQVFLALGLLLLFLEPFIPEKKSPWNKKVDLFGEHQKAA